MLLEAQNELKKQQSLLETFIDSIPDIIFYKDVNKTYITCNKALANLVNKDKDYIIGKKIQRLIFSYYKLINVKNLIKKS